MRMHILICYDVETADAAGRRRLRKVAQACKAYGQRVQKSVFECQLTESRLQALKRHLLRIIDPNADSLRFYRLPNDRAQYVETYGRDTYVDFTQPLII